MLVNRTHSRCVFAEKASSFDFGDYGGGGYSDDDDAATLEEILQRVLQPYIQSRLAESEARESTVESEYQQRRKKFHSHWAERASTDQNDALCALKANQLRLQATIDNALTVLQQRILQEWSNYCNSCSCGAAWDTEPISSTVTIVDFTYIEKRNLPVRRKCSSPDCNAKQLFNPLTMDFFPATPIGQVSYWCKRRIGPWFLILWMRHVH